MAIAAFWHKWVEFAQNLRTAGHNVSAATLHVFEADSLRQTLRWMYCITG